MKVIDIFKTPIVLTYKKNENFSTGFGTVISIIVILLIITTAIFFSDGIYAKINPSIIIQEESTQFYPNV
jgi:hypothetical protein